MRDFAEKWNPVPAWSGKLIQSAELHLERISGRALTLVSGNISSLLQHKAVDGSPIGWGEECVGGNGILRLARDRVLIVCEKDPELLPGWHKEGYAVSRVDDQYALFKLEGPMVRNVFAMGTSLNFHGVSDSCALLFAGIHAIVFKGASDSIWLMVENPHATFLVDWIKKSLKG